MLTRIWTMLETDRQTVRTTNHSTVADLMNKLGCSQEGTRILPGSFGLCAYVGPMKTH
ncbi:MAG: hypothetical protein GX338_11930 [Firmicutes bacterium]|nr:hypothetical protein [Bacillota bacterium]